MKHFYIPLCVRRRIRLLIRALSIFLLVSFALLNVQTWTINKSSPGHPMCPSQVHAHSVALAAKRIHIISSQPTDHAPGLSQGIPKPDNNKDRERNFFDDDCVDLILAGHAQKIKICIHDPTVDLVVSKEIKTRGAWERENVAELSKALDLFHDLVLVDLGSNIGTFSLPAAAKGAEVIAVDAVLENHHLLQRSLALNGLWCNVTLIHNAVHRKRGRMKIYVNPSNIGGSAVMEIPDFRMETVNDSQIVDAICLDDLVPLVKGRSVFLKMDIEGSEDSVLECADLFFKQVNVKVLLIEWTNYHHNVKGTSTIKIFLKSHHMIPTWGVDRERVIDLSASDNWPDNVFWMKE